MSLDDFRHVTWRGRGEMVAYWFRRSVLRRPDAPAADRCFMGAPVGPHLHCPRSAEGDSLWCARHTPVSPVVNEEPQP
jgi:hypothetical protein